MIKISYLAIDIKESLKHDQNYDQQAKEAKTHCFGIDCNIFYSRQYSWDYRHEHERRK